VLQVQQVLSFLANGATLRHSDWQWKALGLLMFLMMFFGDAPDAYARFSGIKEIDSTQLNCHRMGFRGSAKVWQCSAQVGVFS